MLEQIANGRTDRVFDWLAAGHSPHAVDAQGVALVRWCAYYGDVSAIRQLCAHGVALSALGANLGLNDAAFHRHWRLCEFLLEQGADANLADPDSGETPLHAALCVANRPATARVVQVLLAHGADPNARTFPDAPTGHFMRDTRTRAETPLHRAAAFADAEVVQQLLQAGATPDARDQHGDTPLAWASWHLRPDAVLRLLCHGDFTIHPARDGSYDHGRGWGVMEQALLGRPCKG